jgi:hypothetical protein
MPIVLSAIMMTTASFMDEAGNKLTELLPIIARYIQLPGRRGGPIPDSRHRLCAKVCADIWREFHGAIQPYSENLQKACEEYWRACGQPPTGEVDRPKNWERYLVELVSPPQPARTV